MLNVTLREQHKFHRDNNAYHQFPCRVASYPYRHDIVCSTAGTDEKIKLWWDQKSGIGTTFNDYATKFPFTLQWNEMDAIETWGMHKEGRLNDQIKFNENTRRVESLAVKLGINLHLTNVNQKHGRLHSMLQRNSTRAMVVD